MNKKISASLVAAVLASTNANADADRDSLWEDVVIQCGKKCDPETEVMNYFGIRSFFARGNQKISVRKRKKIVYSTTVHDFLEEHQVPRNESSIRTYAYDPDQPLSCEWDPDWDCSDWDANAATSDLMNLMESTTLSFVVTQQFIDNNLIMQKKINFLVTMISAIPISRYIQLATAYSKLQISERIGILLGAGAGWQLSDMIAALVATELKVGDKVTIQGGVITIEETSGDGDGYGDGYGGGNHDYGEGSDYEDAQLVCNTYSTNTGAGTSLVVKRRICYFS